MAARFIASMTLVLPTLAGGIAHAAGAAGSSARVNPIWVARSNGPGNANDEANAMGQSLDGTRVYVTGTTVDPLTYFDYGTVAYDAATGTQIWVAQYNSDGSCSCYDEAFALVMSPNGGRLDVTGRSVGLTTSYDYATVAFNAVTGARIWAARYNGPADGEDLGYAVGVSPDGTRVFVTGSSATATDHDYATLAYNAATGAQIWSARYAGGSAYTLGVSPDGARVFVAGTTATVAYDAATGARLWATPDALSNDLAVSSDGARVHVTGGGLDYRTAAYDAGTGVKVWEAQYNGPGNSADLASWLGLSPDGFWLYVTGESYGLGSRNDYATLAYGTTAFR